MRHILERSPRIALARENHFVGHLREREGARYYFRRAGDLKSDDAVRQIVEMLYGGGFQRQSRWREVSTFWKWLIENVDRGEMERRLLAAERTERGMFAAFLRTYADWRGRPLMGEKTPAHLAYVEILLDWFPGGRVIHMIRDPRAVYVSDRRRRREKRRKPYSWLMKVPFLLEPVLVVQTTLVWRNAARRHQVLKRQFPEAYLLVRFEDLVERPSATLSGVFTFLGVDQPTDATDVRVVSSGYNLGAEGLDAAAASRWRQQIHPLANRWLSTALRPYLRRLGYTGSMVNGAGGGC